MPTAPIRDDAQAGLYEEYFNDSTHESEDGLLVLPVSDGPPAVVRTHEPFAVERQAFRARKRRTPPVFPAPRPDGPPADGSVSTRVSQAARPPLPQIAGGGQLGQTFEVSGEYVYVETATGQGKPHGAAGGLPGPGFARAGESGGSGYPFGFPVMDTAAGVRALVGGFGVLWPLAAAPDFATGRYEWPSSTVGGVGVFADPSLS